MISRQLTQAVVSSLIFPSIDQGLSHHWATISGTNTQPVRTGTNFRNPGLSQPFQDGWQLCLWLYIVICH